MKSSDRLTIVIKIGTSSIVNEESHEPVLSILTLIVEAAVKLRKDGYSVIIVSSGAVGVGLRRMDVNTRPTYLPRMQALAAVGQCRLMNIWDDLFAHLRQPVAQVLLTRNDIADRTRYVNAQNTFAELLEMGVIPIVNENDTLAVSEIKFGDNDTLSAITAAMVQASYLFLMTDVDGLYTSNPRTNTDARVIETVPDVSSLSADVSTSGSSLGTGGMGTKIVAARLATSVGVTTIITSSSRPASIHELVRHFQSREIGDTTVEGRINGPSPSPHTRFLPSPSPILSRSFWLLYGLTPRGSLFIDTGAYNAILKKAGLLPAGVVAVDGHFGQQESVRIIVMRKPSPSALNGDFPHKDEEPKEIGRALVNYGSTEISLVKGLRSTQICSVLGYADSEYVAHRENISLLNTSGQPI